MTNTIEALITEAKEELKDGWKDADYPEDLCAEIADSSIPVYYNQVAEIGASDLNLMTEEPELGAASGSNYKGMQNTAVAFIAANIYERLSNELGQYLNELQEEAESEEEEDDND